MRATRIYKSAWSSVSLAILLGSATLVGAELASNKTETKADPKADAEGAGKVGDDDVDIVIKGIPTKGRVVLPATETEFKFKLHDINTIVTFRWTDLDEYERKRVQKLYGLEVAGDRQVFGAKMEGVRLKLQNGKFVEGLPIPDRNRPGLRALRTATAPLIMVPENEIKEEETIVCYESDFFSARDIYDRKILEKPPGTTDAAAHLEMSRFAASIGLFDKGIEHLEAAKIIDPRTEERNQDFRAELFQRHANQQAQEILLRMTREMRAGDYGSAFDDLLLLDRTFKNSDLRSRWDALRQQIVEGARMDANKKVVQMSYRIAMDLVQNKLFAKIPIDEKGNTVPSIPGKLVTTKQGLSFKGILVGIGGAPVTDDPYEKADPSAVAPDKKGNTAAAKSPTADDVMLKMTDTTLTIPGKDILSITDIDLSVASKFAEASYDELKEYVQGADGLKADMYRKISRVVKLSVPEVSKIFEGRLAKDAVYNGGVVQISPNYASYHDADYGIGSWLRPGAPKPMKYIQYDKNPSQANQNRNNNRYGQGGGRNQQQQNQQNQAQQKEEETAEETDDPAIWWKHQNSSTRLKILKAMAAEKVFKTYNTNNVSCPTCANKGIIGQTAAGGNEAVQRCPTCRGIGVLYKIIYH